MITADKTTEIFCAVDEFCKEFDKQIDKKSLMSSDGKLFKDTTLKTLSNSCCFKIHYPNWGNRWSLGRC